MKQGSTIKDMVATERPYERCQTQGAGSLTDIELLAVLLRTGTRGVNSLEMASEILSSKSQKNSILQIHQYTLEQLLQIKGIGKVKALQILCLSELSRRLAKATASMGLSFTNPSSIANYYMEDMRHQTQEHMKLLMLNTNARLIGETNVSKGTVNASVISPRELFIEALQKNAVSIIILHNHPSGDVTPSREDRLITIRIKEAGALIGIALLDHIIIGNNCYMSFNEQGLL
ncbi:MAG: DNA repair protein RadC [Lachnospiraceae bacterium]